MGWIEVYYEDAGQCVCSCHAISVEMLRGYVHSRACVRGLIVTNFRAACAGCRNSTDGSFATAKPLVPVSLCMRPFWQIVSSFSKCGDIWMHIGMRYTPGDFQKGTDWTRTKRPLQTRTTNLIGGVGLLNDIMHLRTVVLSVRKWIFDILCQLWSKTWALNEG